MSFHFFYRIVEAANLKKKFLKMELSLLNHLKDELILISLILAPDFARRTQQKYPSSTLLTSYFYYYGI